MNQPKQRPKIGAHYGYIGATLELPWSYTGATLEKHYSRTTAVLENIGAKLSI